MIASEHYDESDYIKNITVNLSMRYRQKTVCHNEINIFMEAFV